MKRKHEENLEGNAGDSSKQLKTEGSPEISKTILNEFADLCLQEKFQQALAWYEKVKESYSHVLKQDEVLIKTVKFTKKAAIGSEPQAQFLYGKILCEGILCPQDIFMGVKWLSRAADQGHAEAQCLLAKIILGKRDYYFAQYPEEVQLKKARALLEKSAAQDNPDAKLMLQNFKAKKSKKTNAKQELKLFEEIIHDAGFDLPAEPAAEKANSLDVVLDHKNLSKRVRVKDKTTHGALWAKKMTPVYAMGERERNNVVANFTLVFSTGEGNAQDRIYRTIPISMDRRETLTVDQVLGGSEWENEFKKILELESIGVREYVRS